MGGHLKLSRLALMGLVLGAALFAVCGNQRAAAEQNATKTAPAPAEMKIENETPEAPFKIGFLYKNALSDVGEIGAQEEARKALEKLPNVETLVRDKALSSKDIFETVTEMIDAGCTLIIGESYSLMDYMYEAARRHPDIQFLHYGGYKTRPNLSVFDARDYEASYLAGMVAGGMSVSGLIGYVAAAPVPGVIRCINAFALGAREINPAVKVCVAWTNSWSNSGLERQIATALLDLGADVLAQQEDSPAVQAAAEERGVYSIGYYTDMARLAPKTQLTAVVFHWQEFYREVVARMRDASFKPGMFWLGMSAGVVDLAPYNPAIPQSLREKVATRRHEIMEDKFRVFTGPLVDKDNVERIPAGKVADDRDLLGMTWLVEGVSGEAE